jgi:hypothetical protein
MGHMKDIAIDEANKAASRRGRNNRKRGNSLERIVCGKLGITRTGMFGGKVDGGKHDEWIAIQVKSGGTFPERIWGLVMSVPRRAGQARAAVHITADGPGKPSRALITMDLDEFIEQFAPQEQDGGQDGGDSGLSKR